MAHPLATGCVFAFIWFLSKCRDMDSEVNRASGPKAFFGQGLNYVWTRSLENGGSGE